MTSNDFARLSTDYLRIEKAIRFLEESYRDQPDLAEVAQNIHLSPYHFQRLFKRWAGISPKQFI
ncbi:MAG: AraC family transcriptional regulator, partial [Anaerolineae bacterium]|nr:AraC family transcriptional regulator [Anaerolineae bacterium]